MNFAHVAALLLLLLLLLLFREALVSGVAVFPLVFLMVLADDLGGPHEPPGGPGAAGGRA